MRTLPGRRADLPRRPRRGRGRLQRRRARITASPLTFTAGHRRALAGSTALRQLIFVGFSRRAAAGHGREPTKNSNPTNHMHLGRRRCFYLAVLKSGNRASGRPPRAQSDKRSVRGKQGSDDGLTQNLYPASKPREGTGRGPHAGTSGANGTKIIAAVSHLGPRPRWRQGSVDTRSAKVSGDTVIG